MTRPLVIYHASCQDGFCAAWVARRCLGKDVDFLPAQYGDPVPVDVSDRDVYVLDFSYKRPDLLGLIEDAAQVVVLDHHVTAKEELAGDLSLWRDGRCWKQPTIWFDMEHSGAALAWGHFFPGEPVPHLVQYVEDRDLWKWKLPCSREVSAALASYPHDFETWDTLHREMQGDNEDLVVQGSAILRYQGQQVANQCKNAVEITLDGHKVLSCNATLLISETAGKLAEGRPFGATYFVRGDGKKVWSLRSTPDGVDVAAIARKFGGGGHRDAAGFTE